MIKKIQAAHEKEHEHVNDTIDDITGMKFDEAKEFLRKKNSDFTLIHPSTIRCMIYVPSWITPVLDKDDIIIDASVG